MRKIKTIFLFTFFSFLSTEVYTIISPGVKPIKKPIHKKKNDCCILSADMFQNVKLLKLCQKENSTFIYMQLENTANACSYLEKISLTDDSGRKYKPLSLNGISQCPKINLIKAGIAFSWEFEKLEKGISSIDIEEDPSSPAPTYGDWNWWEWKNVTVKHCNL